MQEIVAIVLRGKDGPLGIIASWVDQQEKFQQDEIYYLVNIANLLGLTLQNVRCSSRWLMSRSSGHIPLIPSATPFWSTIAKAACCAAISDSANLLGRENQALDWPQSQRTLSAKQSELQGLSLLRRIAGEGDDPDPWLARIFSGLQFDVLPIRRRQLGTVHVLKDITDRKRAEEKYRTLVSNVQEGVFISTPQGPFPRFQRRFVAHVGLRSPRRIDGIDIGALYVNSADRERLKKLLHEHGAVADFEFEIRRKDGEIRTVMESSIAVRDTAGNVTAYPGIRAGYHRAQARRAGNSPPQSRIAGIEFHRANAEPNRWTLPTRCIARSANCPSCSGLDTSSLYLFDESGPRCAASRLSATVRSTPANFPPVTVQPELI